MKTISKCLVILLSLLLTSCSSDDGNDSKIPDAEPIRLKAELSGKLEKDNAFAINLFKTVYQADDQANLFISPISVSMALNMTLNGANGITKTEMLQALNTENYSLDEINEYSKTLREALIKVDPSTKLSIANSIWYHNTFVVETPFIDVNKANYNAEVKGLDFTSSDAITQINNWCASNTNNRIPEIISEISPQTMMFLINAVYFKGIWLSSFDKSLTINTDFRAENKSMPQTIAMMVQKASFAHTSDDNCAYLELPYGNKAFSMIIALPHEGKSTGDVIDNLNYESWSVALSRLTVKDVNLQLPRFKFESTYNLHENNILPAMGMKTAFTDLADFKGISKNGGLAISKVIHKTFVEVNEEGTEAAAVTKVEIVYTSIDKPTGISFIVNKPFIFAIREKSTGLILFMGKVGQVMQ